MKKPRVSFNIFLCRIKFFPVIIVKIACRFWIWKKKISSLDTVLLKLTFCLCIYFIFTKNPIILSLFKIDSLNFTIYILTILTCPLKIYIIGLHNLISVSILKQLKRNSNTVVFPVNTAKFLRTAFFIEHFGGCL